MVHRNYHNGLKTTLLLGGMWALLLAIGALIASGTGRMVWIVVFAAPIATASYPMADAMGCDGRLAGELVTTSTLASVVTLFLWVLVNNAVLL